MASTRNRNCPGDYALEQAQNKGICRYSEYGHSAYGYPMETMLPGDGLLQGRVAPTKLSGNSCDIESQLFGIGSTNLVKPKEPVTPDIHPLLSLNMIHRIPVLIPQPLVVAKEQRPYPLH
jgi:hypothetical protein